MSAAGSPSTNGGGGSPASAPLRLGGMALRNGLLIHGPSSWAAAARLPGGAIEVASGPKPSLARGKLAGVPLLRGPLRLAEAMAVIPLARMRLRSARLPFEDPAVIGAIAASTAASAALRRLRAATVGRELAVTALGVLPALTALADRDLSAYHGVEHKAIGAYETGADPAAVPKEHPRCGSNLVGPMIALSVTGQLLAERLAPRPGPLPRALAALASIGAAVELFVYAERNPGSPIGRAVHGPGHEIQRRFSTSEPTPGQLEVGVAALDEILRVEGATADTFQAGPGRPRSP